jgi:hypothetical protein
MKSSSLVQSIAGDSEDLTQILENTLRDVQIKDGDLLRQYYTSGKAMNTIAADRNTSIGSIRVILHRARGLLAEVLTGILDREVTSTDIIPALNTVRWHSSDTLKWWVSYCSDIKKSQKPKKKVTVGGKELSLLLDRIGFRTKFKTRLLTLTPEFLKPYGHVIKISGGDKTYGTFLIADAQGEFLQTDYDLGFREQIDSRSTSLYKLLMGYGPVNLTLALADRHVKKYEDPENNIYQNLVDLLAPVTGIAKVTGSISLPTAYKGHSVRVSMKTYGADRLKNNGGIQEVYLSKLTDRSTVAIVRVGLIDGRLAGEKDWGVSYYVGGRGNKLARDAKLYKNGGRLKAPPAVTTR